MIENVLPDDPGAYSGARGSLFLLNREGNWFDEDGTPSLGHGNAPEDYLPIVKLPSGSSAQIHINPAEDRSAQETARAIHWVIDELRGLIKSGYLQSGGNEQLTEVRNRALELFAAKVNRS